MSKMYIINLMKINKIFTHGIQKSLEKIGTFFLELSARVLPSEENADSSPPEGSYKRHPEWDGVSCPEIAIWYERERQKEQQRRAYPQTQASQDFHDETETESLTSEEENLMRLP